jgi:general stress protein 26
MGTVKNEMPTDDERRQRVREILDDARFVMMLTRASGGELHSRPMSIARVSDDGTLYFSSSIESVKVQDLQRDPRVDLVFQARTQYAHLSGRVEILRSRALIHELWQEDWKLWYPEGKDDPQIVILAVHPERAEYWDQSGTRGLSFLYRAAKAFVKGEEMETKPQDHGKVRM